MEGMIVLVWFSLMFVGIALWAFWPTNRARLQQYGEIPLKEDRHG